MDEEIVIWEAKPSPLDELPTLVLCGLFIWLIVPGFVAAWRILELLTTKYTLTSERLTVATGVLSRRIDEIELYRVKDTRLEIPIALRVFGLAHILLFTSDETHRVVTLRAVTDAELIRNQIRGLVEKRREQKGVRELDV